MYEHNAIEFMWYSYDLQRVLSQRTLIQQESNKFQRLARKFSAVVFRLVEKSFGGVSAYSKYTVAAEKFGGLQV